MKIFTAISDFISDFWDWGGWQTIGSVFTVIWFIVENGISFLTGLFNDILTLVDGITGVSLQAASTTFFSSEPILLANYLLPVDTMLQSLALIVTLIPIAIIIRIVKSFIPTVA